MTAIALEECANVSRGLRCPYADSTPHPQGGHRTWLTWMRWASGLTVEFWSCDECRRTWRVPESTTETT